MDRLEPALIAVPGVEVRVLERCNSTNSVLLAEASDGAVLLAAETQSAGRGRRGRRWYSTPGSDITFSLAREVRRPTRELAALPLVAGVAVAQALRRLGIAEASLKWPNDLVVQGGKLGGILVESRRGRAVVGVGVNCTGAKALGARLRRRVAALDEFTSVSRNVVIREAAAALMVALDRFEQSGFDELRAQWESLDAYAGQQLLVRLADGRSMSGRGGGLAADGALRLVTASGERFVRNGRIIGARPA